MTATIAIACVEYCASLQRGSGTTRGQSICLRASGWNDRLSSAQLLLSLAQSQGRDRGVATDFYRRAVTAVAGLGGSASHAHTAKAKEIELRARSKIVWAGVASMDELAQHFKALIDSISDQSVMQQISATARSSVRSGKLCSFGFVGLFELLP